MYAEERQEAIAELIARRGRAAVTMLADMFSVTPETVRRDLDRLERRGLVRRVHGGAVPAGVLTVLETGVAADREQERTAAKDRIAAAAADLLPGAGGSIALDAGTTTSRLLGHLARDGDLTVVTNAVPIAARLATHPGVHLHVVGGRVRGSTQAAVGPVATAMLERMHTDVAFLGTNGLTATFGASTPDGEEAATKRALAAVGQQVVVLADATKLGREHFHQFAPIEAIDILITDRDAPSHIVADLEDTGVKVVLA